MNLNPYRTRNDFIPRVTRTSPADSADGFMTVFGEIEPNQISKRCSTCRVRQPLVNYYKKPVSKLKKSQVFKLDKTDPDNYRNHCIACHDKRLNR